MHVTVAHFPESVTEIYLSQNILTEVPDMSHFTHLSKLYLYDNPLKTIIGLPQILQELHCPAMIQVLGVKCFHTTTISLLRKLHYTSLQQPPREVLARGLEAVKGCYEEDVRVLNAQAR